MKVRTEPQQIDKELQSGRNWKGSQNLYNITARNERMVSGIQWHGVKSKNLAKTTYNYLRQVETTQVAAVMAKNITINRSADELSQENEVVTRAAKILTSIDKVNWERTEMKTMNEDILKDSFDAGLGVSYWFWDETVKTGNDFVTSGDFKGEVIDSINLYVANPNEIEIQKQDWNIISSRKTVQQVRQIAKRNKVSEDEIMRITGDANTVYEAYDKAQDEQDGVEHTNSQIDLIIKMWKEFKAPMADPEIWFTMVTNNVVIKKPTNTELTKYPIAIMPWFKRKRFIYGVSPLTEVIANQQVANKQASMRHTHAQLMAIPKVVVNDSMIKGFGNNIGEVNKVTSAPPGTAISNAIAYIQPAAMTIDVDKSIDDSINRTKDLMGVNQNITGEARPENFRAIVAQQKAAAVPLESVERRYIKYIKDVAEIWEDFYKSKYKLVRKAILEDEEGNKEAVEFTGTDFKDIFLKTKIDVGESSAFSEFTQQSMLDAMWDRKIITDPLQYVKRIPSNQLALQEELIDELGGGDEAQMQKKQAMFALMADFLQGQPPEIQQQIQQLPPEEQEEAVMQLVMQQQGQQQEVQ